MNAEEEAETQELLENTAGINSRGAYHAWILRYERCLESLRAKCRNRLRRISTGRRNSLVARIARLEGARRALDQRFVRTGTGRADSANLSWIDIETAFNRRVLTGAVINSHHIEPEQFLNDARTLVLDRVRDYLSRHTCLKVNTVLNGEFVTRTDTSVKGITTKNQQLFRTSDLNDWYTRHVIETILTSLEEFQERDSGWALSRILNLIVNINKYNPMRAGCWIQIPARLQHTRSIVNVRTHDNACFAWAVTAALYPVRHHTERCSQYPHYTTVLKLDGIEFPMTLNQITRFERLNELSINVFTRQEEQNENTAKIVPLRLTDNKRDIHVNLLYLTSSQHCPNDNDICVTTGHFAWIKNLSRLINSQLSKNINKKYICDRYIRKS